MTLASSFKFGRAAGALTLAIFLAGCNPPSVQKVIDEAKAKEEAAKPRLENPVVTVAQEEGREVYDRYLLGTWAPENACDNPRLRWTFEDETFTRPTNITDLKRPCKLAVVEALAGGKYAIAGFCPRLELADEPTVVPLTRIGNDKIIIANVGGGALQKCE